jgi:predicted XRE-type DNA-binding protein
MNRTVDMNLQEMIRTRGLKQGWIAGQLGLDDSMFSRIIRGETLLPTDKVRPLATMLRVSMAEIRRTQGSVAVKDKAARTAAGGEKTP